MFLVIGATGTTGRAVLAELARRQLPARALVRPRPSNAPPRDPRFRSLPGVDYLTGDAGEHDDLRRALQDVRKVVVAMGNGPRQEAIELGVVAAARAAGVEELVKLSAPVVGPDVPVAIARLHHRVERAVEASGVAHTFLRPYAFMQNLLSQSALIQATGRFVGTTGDTPMNLVDARDVADVAVAALVRPAAGQQVHVLTGPEAVSYPEAARRMSALGRPVAYVDLTPEQLATDLRRAGRPEWLVEHLLEIQAMAVAVPESPTDTLREVTGQAPRTLDAFLREHAVLFQPAAGVATASPV